MQIWFKMGKIEKLMKAVFYTAIIILAYLYVLNGRYSKVDDYCYFDKWTKRIVEYDEKTGMFQ